MLEHWNMAAFYNKLRQLGKQKSSQKSGWMANYKNTSPTCNCWLTSPTPPKRRPNTFGLDVLWIPRSLPFKDLLVARIWKTRSMEKKGAPVTHSFLQQHHVTWASSSSILKRCATRLGVTSHLTKLDEISNSESKWDRFRCREFEQCSKHLYHFVKTCLNIGWLLGTPSFYWSQLNHYRNSCFNHLHNTTKVFDHCWDWSVFVSPTSY